ncbi:hypothetical protein [Bradyrhizobium sp. CCGB01]|uniref:hypothetical protein n=1 Tax=Bradyrhizobium sp. CCGB01 TaxID=2949634 RepID=UPI0020B369A2|nr:hypothetical protein [Bradyrhizobium sp. CCGB01]MCP3410031.1 hypothetical protein [Bradyrhizobium sp. CCGB01]
MDIQRTQRGRPSLPAIHQAFQIRPAGCDHQQLGCWPAPESSSRMFQDHHVFPQKFASHPVIRLLGERFNHDAIRNLIKLPSRQRLATEFSSSPHTGGHLGKYYEGFCEYLKQVKSSPGFAAASTGDARALDEIASDVNALVAAAKYAQANGHLFANTPEGMTPEEANAENRKWFSTWRKYAADNAEQIRQMQETVDQLHNAGRRDAALHFPLLYPTSGLSMAERIEVLKRFPEGSPISLQSTAVGPVPGLPGLTPSQVDTRLRGFSPPAHSDLNEKEGFTRSDPRFSGGSPAFPMPSPDEQRLGRLPPSTAMPPTPQVLQFHRETGDPLRFTDGSPMLGPDPYDMPHDPADGAAVLRGMAIFAAAMATPALLPLLPIMAPIAALGLAGATAARAEPAGDRATATSATEASPYGPFSPNGDMSSTGNEDRPLGSGPAASQAAGNSFDQGPTSAGTFDDRFGRWSVTPNGITPDRPSTVSEPRAVGAIARRSSAPDPCERVERG